MSKFRSFVLLLGLCVFSNSLQLHTSTSQHYESYGIFWGDSPKHFNTTGLLAIADPKDGCKSFKNKNDVEGKIVLIDKDGCYPQKKMKHAKNAGAIGAIISAYQFAGQLNYIYDGDKNDKIGLPTVEVSIDDFKDIKKSMKAYNDTTVTIYPEKNPFDWMFQDSIWVTWMVVFIPWNTGLIALAGYKLFRFIQAFGVEPSITQLSLVLLILSRIPPLLWSFDPKSYFQVYPDWLSSIFSSAHFPFMAGSYLLLAFYWQELVASVKHLSGVMPKLNKMKIPFAIIFFILLGLEVGTWIPRALYLNTEEVTTLIVVIFVVILIGASIFYFIQAIRILRVFGQSTSQKDSSRVRNLRRVTAMIIILGVLYICCAILTGALGATLEGPRDIVTLYWTVYPLFALAGTTHILMFNTEVTQKSTSSEITMSTKPPSGKPFRESTNSNSPMDESSNATALNLSQKQENEDEV